tara:strand:+ start:12336 stop:12782 length:447 start_codon:yes stop_codon:yes gene_type:complete
MSQCLSTTAITDTNNKIDKAEFILSQSFEPEETYVTHRFTDGLYIRQIYMKKGAKVVSKIHKTNHPFAILKGDVSVYSANEGVVRYRGPMFGITYPSTRRLLLVHEDTIWITFHPGKEKTPEEFEKRIIEPYTNPFIAQENLINTLLQ